MNLWLIIYCGLPIIWWCLRMDGNWWILTMLNRWWNREIHNKHPQEWWTIICLRMFSDGWLTMLNKHKIHENPSKMGDQILAISRKVSAMDEAAGWLVLWDAKSPAIISRTAVVHYYTLPRPLRLNLNSVSNSCTEPRAGSSFRLSATCANVSRSRHHPWHTNGYLKLPSIGQAVSPPSVHSSAFFSV